MIIVTIYKSSTSDVGLEVIGHANYAPKGKDIVCSAVFQIHFVLDKLVPSEYDSRVHLPHKKVFLIVKLICDILFSGKIER